MQKVSEAPPATDPGPETAGTRPGSFWTLKPRQAGPATGVRRSRGALGAGATVRSTVSQVVHATMVSSSLDGARQILAVA